LLISFEDWKVFVGGAVVKIERVGIGWEDTNVGKANVKNGNAFVGFAKSGGIFQSKFFSMYVKPGKTKLTAARPNGTWVVGMGRFVKRVDFEGKAWNGLNGSTEKLSGFQDHFD
jgi:hypothetical protein